MKNNIKPFLFWGGFDVLVNRVLRCILMLHSVNAADFFIESS